MMVEIALIDSIADRLAHELVTTAGEPVSHDHVVDVVEAAAKPFADAPLQQFVPLLVENAARSQFRREGIRRATAGALEAG
jgi:hypothetical protein